MRCLRGRITISLSVSLSHVCFQCRLVQNWGSRREEKSCEEPARSDLPGTENCAGQCAETARWWLQVYRLLHHHLHLTTSLLSVCLCLMEEVEIRLGWSPGHCCCCCWTGGKSVSRLPSEYMITVVISQTKSRLGARRSRDEKTEKPDRASSFVTDITLPSSPLIRTQNQHW